MKLLRTHMPIVFMISKKSTVEQKQGFDSQAIFPPDDCFLKLKIIIDSNKELK